MDNPFKHIPQPPTITSKGCNSESLPSHSMSATVQLIQDFVGFKAKEKYGWNYWSGIAKRYAKRERIDNDTLFVRMEGILKGLRDLPDKYGRGQTLTNKLKKHERNRKET